MNRSSIFTRIVVAAILLQLTTTPAWSQEYASEELKEMGSLLKRTSVDYKEEKDQKTGVVTHLGLRLFPQDAPYPYGDILKFVERFALHVQIIGNKTERSLLLSDKKVSMSPLRLLPLDSLSQLNVISDGERFHVSWKNCKVSFPKEYNLIFGQNKKESDDYFRNSLLAFYADRGSETADTTKRISVMMPRDSASYYVQEGANYIIHEVNSNRFYVKLNDSIMHPIYAEKFASESVANLMQQIVSSERFILSVRQNLYGYRKATFAVSLKAFADYCASTGCSPYIGIEEESETNVKAVVVYRNEFFGYNHLLYIDVPRTVLSKQEGEIKARLYCFIPTHNLKQRL